tara:strand:- start:660 stop:1067 length:408 start_codon:yes stop_codon:yes gene_type:complete
MARGSNTKAFSAPPKPKKKFTTKLTNFFKPLGNLFGMNPATTPETKPLRDIIDIRTNNRNRGYRPNQQGKMTYYKDLDENLKKKNLAKKNKPLYDKIDNFLMKGKPVKNIDYKGTAKNEKGEKLTLLRPPIRKKP